MVGSAASGIARLGRLPWILLGALALRLWLFTGILGVDDSIYALQAHLFPGRVPDQTYDVFAARIGQLVFWPLSFNPYRPAASLHVRFFTSITIPAALLAARFVVDGPMRMRPLLGWAAATIVALFWLLCDVINHEEATRWRVGAEWAQTALQRHPGALVITDGHTRRQLEFMNGYESPYRLTMYLDSDPAPPAGSLLLDVERQVDAVAEWNSIPPPHWWRAEPPAREVIGERLVPGRFRLRRARLPPEHVTLSRVLP